MKVLHVFGMVVAAAMFSAGAWLGCSSDSGVSNNNSAGDGGSKDGASNNDSSTGDSGGSGDSGGEGGTTPHTVSCAAYCDEIQTVCTGGNAQYALTDPHRDPPFSAKQQCLNMCAAMTLGTYNDGKDSVGCRMYHADNAKKEDPATHCAHAGPYGGGVCGDWCGAFCNLATKLCTTANGNPQQWASAQDCLSACQKYPYQVDAGEFDPNDLNHLNCFQYHLREAYTGPDAAEPDDSGDTVAQSHCGDLVIGDASSNPPGSCIR